MARDTSKEVKGLSFETVATEKTEVNSNINSDINPPVNFNVDPLEKLQEENPAKELTTILKGIYFDSEVAEVIDQQAKRLGRGGKSQLVNEIVKNYFSKQGLL